MNRVGLEIKYQRISMDSELRTPILLQNLKYLLLEIVLLGEPKFQIMILGNHVWIEGYKILSLLMQVYLDMAPTKH